MATRIVKKTWVTKYYQHFVTKDGVIAAELVLRVAALTTDGWLVHPQCFTTWSKARTFVKKVEKSARLDNKLWEKLDTIEVKPGALRK